VNANEGKVWIKLSLYFWKLLRNSDLGIEHSN